MDLTLLRQCCLGMTLISAYFIPPLAVALFIVWFGIGLHQLKTGTF